MGVFFKVNNKQAISEFERLKKNLPFALSRATNLVAKKVVEAEKDSIKNVFDRPNRWTQNSVAVVKYSNKTDLIACVDFKQGTSRSASKYLKEQIFSGNRRVKGIEKKLQGMGYLPRGHFVAAWRGVKLDQHGNISKATFGRIIKGLQAKTNFALHRPHGRLQPGVYQRLTTRGKVKPLLVFFKGGYYRKRLPWFETAQKTIAVEHATTFKEVLSQAMKSSKY